MQEEGEKLERSLQSKIQERIATDQRLRALIEEEIRLSKIPIILFSSCYGIS